VTGAGVSAGAYGASSGHRASEGVTVEEDPRPDATAFPRASTDTLSTPPSSSYDTRSIDHSTSGQHHHPSNIQPPGAAPFESLTQGNVHPLAVVSDPNLYEYIVRPCTSLARGLNCPNTLVWHRSASSQDSYPCHAALENIVERVEPDFGLSQDGYDVNPVLSSPDVLTDDGIFVPGSTYQELHKTLRSEIFQIAQSQPNTRRPSHHDLDQPDSGSMPPAHLAATEVEQEKVPSGASTPPELTTAQEVMLWNNWLNEIASWVELILIFMDTVLIDIA